jgi:hypothetical protein
MEKSISVWNAFKTFYIHAFQNSVCKIGCALKNNRPVSHSWKVTRLLHESEALVELAMIETCKWLLNVLKKVSIIASSTLVSLWCKSLVTFHERETGLLNDGPHLINRETAWSNKPYICLQVYGYSSYSSSQCWRLHIGHEKRHRHRDRVGLINTSLCVLNTCLTWSVQADLSILIFQCWYHQ